MIKGKKKIKMPISYLKSVKNHEFFVAYVELKEIIAKSGLTSELVLLLLEKVTRHSERLRRLNAEPSRHPLSEQIEELSSGLRHWLGALKAAIDALSESMNPEEADHGQVLKYWILADRADMVSYHKVKQINAIKSLSDIEILDERVGEALEFTGLKMMFERASKAYAKMSELMNIRLSDWAELKSLREGLRAELMYDLRLLLSVIEGFANMESPM